MMSNRIESHAEYTSRSVGEARAHLARIEAAPLADRRAAAIDFGKALRNPALVAERLSWLLDGHYGFGEMKLAQHVLSLSARSNKEAQLVQLIAAFEWQCPRAGAAKAWVGLSDVEKGELRIAVLGAMTEALESIATESEGA